MAQIESNLGGGTTMKREFYYQLIEGMSSDNKEGTNKSTHSIWKIVYILVVV